MIYTQDGGETAMVAATEGEGLATSTGGRWRNALKRMALPAAARPFPVALIVDPTLYACVRLHQALSRFATHFVGDDLWRPAELDEFGIAVVQSEAVPFWHKHQGKFFLQGCNSHARIVAPVPGPGILYSHDTVLK